MLYISIWVHGANGRGPDGVSDGKATGRCRPLRFPKFGTASPTRRPSQRPYTGTMGSPLPVNGRDTVSPEEVLVGLPGLL